MAFLICHYLTTDDSYFFFIPSYLMPPSPAPLVHLSLFVDSPPPALPFPSPHPSPNTRRLPALRRRQVILNAAPAPEKGERFAEGQWRDFGAMLRAADVLCVNETEAQTLSGLQVAGRAGPDLDAAVAAAADRLHEMVSRDAPAAASGRGGGGCRFKGGASARASSAQRPRVGDAVHGPSPRVPATKADGECIPKSEEPHGERDS